MGRSKAAFVLAVGQLFALPGTVYFWTWTFRAVPESDRHAMQAFNRARRAVQKLAPLYGLRVAELHSNHGMHFHLLVKHRLDVDEVRAVISPYGFGRVHVCRADMQAGQYLAKYLTKEAHYQRYQRRWASFWLWVCAKVSTVQKKSSLL